MNTTTFRHIILVIGLLFGLGHTSLGAAELNNLVQADIILKQALDTANQIQDPQEHDYVLGQIAIAQAKTGDFTGGLQTVSFINSHMYGEMNRKYALLGIVKTQAESGDLQGALQVAESIIDGKDDALRSIAEAQTTAGDFPNAFRIADKFGASFWRDQVLLDIAKAQVLRGDIQGAWQTADKLNTSSRKDNIWIAIAAKQAEQGNMQQALKTLKSANKLSQAHGLGYIACKQASAGNVQGALDTVVHISMDQARSDACRCIGEAQEKVGDRQGHLKTFKMAIEPSLKGRDESRRNSALISLAGAEAWAGEMQSALKTASMIQPDSKTMPLYDFGKHARANALGNIAVAQAENGDVVGALKTAESIPSLESVRHAVRRGLNNVQMHAISTIATAQARRGDSKGAMQTVDSLHTYDGVNSSDEIIRARALENIAIALADNGIIKESLETVSKIKDPKSKERIIPRIALAQFKAGNLHEALKTLSERPRNERVYCEMATQQTQAGEPQAALAWINKLNSPQDKARPLLCIAQALLKIDQPTLKPHSGPSTFIVGL